MKKWIWVFTSGFLVFMGCTQKVADVFDEKQVEQVAEGVIWALEDGDYEEILGKCGDRMRDSITVEGLEEIALDLAGSTGEAEDIRSIKMEGFKKGGEDLVKAVILVDCTKGTRIITVSLDNELNITGLYMREK